MTPLKIKYSGNRPEAGIDEAGRGCLAGPVVAAAVILPDTVNIPFLDDSKKMSPKHRETARNEIIKTALAWGIGTATPAEIDLYNIAGATYLAMHRAVENLSILPASLLVDGKFFNAYRNIPHTCIVGGDGKYAAIAAASVLAKTHRDHLMEEIHYEFPLYAWNKNKGYPTRQHREGIRKYGVSPYHRKSFKLLDEQLPLPFSESRF
ncbi:MAG: ribonuclease HII [Chlorobi bacterium]|nr:ribonuclease HII [Chlorobiota bacterium]